MLVEALEADHAVVGTERSQMRRTLHHEFAEFGQFIAHLAHFLGQQFFHTVRTALHTQYDGFGCGCADAARPITQKPDVEI